MNKFVRLVISASFLSVATLGVAAEAQAAVTPEPPVQVYKSDYTSQLKDLAGKQSKSYIEELATSPGSAQLLYDTAKGQYVAAIDTSREAGSARIGVLGPGCSSTSACVYTGSTPNGYTGTGTLSASWKNVPKFAAGDIKTTMYRGSSGWIAYPNKTITFTTAQTFDKLVRDNIFGGT